MSSRNICRRRSYKRNGIDVKKSVLRVYLRSMDQRDMRHDVINRNRKLPSPSDHVDLPPVKESRESSSSKSASPGITLHVFSFQIFYVFLLHAIFTIYSFCC